ncbi:alpha/beta fold hydrolase [Erythrobacter sp. WG]|uniref:alpha/beta fold hydrolase n=1 Tax=Erythrobacter sp. WG TaxID=2985510 RepID=UPI00226D5C5C|nr:alpha/beta fold hydrolase [Erythrobacter sp. WG]MCX9146104.1 alpha/beta hydrolase [Erythrobacter sp. WG]
MLAVRVPSGHEPPPGEVRVADGTIPLAIAGDGAPLILLHGWTLDHRMWRPQIAGLAASHRLVMPDRRGHGRATAPPDLAREAADVIAIADALGLESLALVGLSQGAAVALDVAVHFPERVTALVAAGAPLPALIPRGEALDLAGLRALVACGDLAGFRAAWGAHPLMRTHRPEAAALAARMLADYDGRDILAPGTPPEITAPALAMLPMPVLALAGEHDTPWRRACAAALAAAVPGARHGLIPRAGHLANADNPLAFNAALAAFLDPGAPA